MNTQQQVKFHKKEALILTNEAKMLEDHIAYLRGDVFGLKLKIAQLREKAVWNLDMADAYRRNTQQFMYTL